MVLLFFIVLSAAVVLGRLLYNKLSDDGFNTNNPELEAFYSMSDETVSSQMRQLMRAAAHNMSAKDTTTEKIRSVSILCAERLVSDGYYKSFIRMDEELSVEKVIIETEAESLQPGSGELVFSEATKIKNSQTADKKKRMFDEALFLKRYEIFLNRLSGKEQPVLS